MRILLLFLFCIRLHAGDKPTICLNMIVKDEKLVIKRCLASVKPLIDYWVIVDTGSTDGTQETIKEFLKDIPGELHERPWVNFGHNRQEALVLAKNKAKYLLFIDADEELKCQDFSFKNRLDQNCYLIPLVTNNGEFQGRANRGFLIRSDLDYRWKGGFHEQLESDLVKEYSVLDNMQILATHTDGHRSMDPDKHKKDVLTLLKLLEEEPENSRYVFYLAQEYAEIKDYPSSLKYHQKRAAMGGWAEEVFFSLYSAARIQQYLQKSPEVFLASYSKAFQSRPTRAEPLFRMAHYFFQEQNYILGYLLTKFALTLPKPTEIAYVEEWVYEYGLLALYADCASLLNKYEEGIDAYKKLIRCTTLSAATRQNAQQHLAEVTALLKQVKDPAEQR